MPESQLRLLLNERLKFLLKTKQDKQLLFLKFSYGSIRVRKQNNLITISFVSNQSFNIFGKSLNFENYCCKFG